MIRAVVHIRDPGRSWTSDLRRMVGSLAGHRPRSSKPGNSRSLAFVLFPLCMWLSDLRWESRRSPPLICPYSRLLPQLRTVVRHRIASKEQHVDKPARVLDERLSMFGTEGQRQMPAAQYDHRLTAKHFSECCQGKLCHHPSHGVSRRR